MMLFLESFPFALSEVLGFLVFGVSESVSFELLTDLLLLLFKPSSLGATLLSIDIL